MSPPMVCHLFQCAFALWAVWRLLVTDAGIMDLPTWLAVGISLEFDVLARLLA